MQSEPEELVELVRAHLAAADLAALSAYLNSLHPADVAEAIARLEPEERQQIFQLLDIHHEADVMEYAADGLRSDIVAALDDRRVSELVEEMHPEEAADLLAEMPEERADHVLELMTRDEAQEVEGLLRYPPDTAGGIMAPAVVRVRDDVSVRDVLAHIRSNDAMHEEDIYNIYVVDEADRVVGAVPLWALLRSPPEAPVREIMEPVQTVPAEMDQEEVAALFGKYDLAAAPVVDRAGRLLGRITFDSIQDVVEEELSEDVSKFAGTDDDELESPSAIRTARLRLPWLLVCLGGTFVSGSVISHFGGTLKAHIMLMVFVPAVMATAGNSGLQTATVTVRSLATGYVDRVGGLPVVLKQIKASVLVALACGLVAGVVGAAWSHWSPDPSTAGRGAMLGLIVGGAMFAAICLSCTLGVCVPLTFRKVGIDPAVASGPLITTSTDIFSLMVYLGVATALLVEVVQ
ncbi:MAG: magnesium transporter [Candidatus Brocadiia bacterium]